ncbi:ArdC-like ssDNA-binding domain-containing protein [Natronolimnohabitans sp. A-GB9]|uniref:ArdC-like ssDNA-binding domain-containing protein n=1 Tax=Natronolimnohabitans sp. A-GB9 TaxID=3069757 RepID=UPI0027AFEB68|nr:ImmA/IrrE family metallo-endopeptidase [Natronolimnohabitans sp. A-GB9]MDQ2051659.1 ArdC-like ssDNA-binding domain-containing protein [Natronolimnohabitans sp. A-GB9]
MATSSSTRETFDDSDTRHDEMHSTIEAWIQDLVNEVNSAVSSEQFKQWLDVQSRFHDYSYRNTLLIKLQCPHATRVAGYRTWQNEFDRHVSEGEKAIWIWAPIIAKQCPECGNSPSYHERSDCEYNDTEPDDWNKGLVGFRPAPVFDISQTKGEPLPELETEANGNAGELIPALLEAASSLEVAVEFVSPRKWSHGSAKGVCQYRLEKQPLVEVRDRENEADLAVTLVHEYAHALLHGGIDTEDERSKRELEAEAVAYIVGRYFGLDTSGSAFYLAAWEGDEPKTILDRLERISSTAQEIIDVVDEVMADD